MSSLGITLLILVFVCIGGVIFYNAWLARREGRELKSLLTQPEPTVDLNRSEPSLVQAGQATNAPAPARPFFDPSDDSSSEQTQEMEPSIDDQQRDVMSGAPVSDSSRLVPPPQTETMPGELGPPTDDAVLRAADEQPDVQPDEPVEPSPSVEPIETASAELPADEQTVDPIESDNQQESPTSAQLITDTESEQKENRFDCVVRLADLSSVTGSRLRQLTADFARVGAKPVIIAGVNAQSGEIEPLVANHHYSSLVLALLLVNRSGAINPMEYSEFANRTQTIADELDVLADVPDMNEVLTRARELDEELATLDAQVAVNVETEQALNPGNLLTVAKRLDLTEQGNNRFVRTGEDRQPVFSVSLGEKANRLVLLLDVPRVPAKSQPIREMVECAWHCCQAFEGKMVDDSGRPIDNELFERIERQLGTHYQALEGAGVPAGSEQARRVFN